jgi:hypothetical protein
MRFSAPRFYGKSAEQKDGVGCNQYDGTEDMKGVECPFHLVCVFTVPEIDSQPEADFQAGTGIYGVDKSAVIVAHPE